MLPDERANCTVDRGSLYRYSSVTQSTQTLKRPRSRLRWRTGGEILQTGTDADREGAGTPPCAEGLRSKRILSRYPALSLQSTHADVGEA